MRLSQDKVGLAVALDRHPGERKVGNLLLENGIAREPIEAIALRDGVAL